MSSEREITDLKAQIENMKYWRGIFLFFAIIFFIAAQTFFLVAIIGDINFLIWALVSFLIGFTLLVLRSSLFSGKIREKKYIILKHEENRKKEMKEQEELEKAERIYRRLKEIDKNSKDDFSLDNLK